MTYLYRLFVIALFVLFIAINAQAGETVSNYRCPVADNILSSIIKIDSLNFCGELVPLQDDEVLEKLERELFFFLDNTSNIILWLKRTNRYFPHIEKELKRNGLPDDLKYITIAESALKPHATSSRGAVGYWQFIEGTGTKYGMQVTPHIDDRRNFYTSTEAAIAYFKDLYTLFGSWTLAAAAYNMGEEGLRAEILVQQVNNYYKLYLSQETQRYLFRVLAAKIILSDPQKFGIVIPKEELYQPLQFDSVEINTVQPVPINLIAQAAGTYFKVIKDLNPHLRNYYLTAGRHHLLLPKNAAAGFSERYENLLTQWLAEKREKIYIVKKGENLSAIATRFSVPIKALMIWNGINNGKKIVPGDKLFIFSKSFQAETANDKNDKKNNLEGIYP